MAFTIRNAALADDPQASPDKVDFDILAQGLAGEGVLSGCAVTAQGTPNNTLSVASGSVRIGGATYSVTSGTVTIATGNATYARFDLITANTTTRGLVAGAPSAVPIFPAVPASTVVLAAVYVPANDTIISATQVEDKRVVLPAVSEVWSVALSDESTTIAAGAAALTWRAPYALTLTNVRASLTAASTAGVVTVDINENGVSMLATKLTIDATEATSTTAAAAHGFSDVGVADDAALTFDVDTAGTGARGLKITLYGTRA